MLSMIGLDRERAWVSRAQAKPFDAHITLPNRIKFYALS